MYRLFYKIASRLSCSWSRRCFTILRPIDKSNTPEKVQKILNELGATGELEFYQVLAISPEALEGFKSFLHSCQNASFDKKSFALIQLKVAQLCDSVGCEKIYLHMAKHEGVSEEEIEKVLKGDLSDPKLNALMQFVTQLVEKKGKVSSDDVDAFKQAGYTDRHVVDVCMNVGLAMTTAIFNELIYVTPDAPTS